MKPLEAAAFLDKSNYAIDSKLAFVEVVLGRPSANCKHFGICKISNVYSNSFNLKTQTICSNPNRVYAIANWKESEYFELTIEKISIPENTFEKHFGSGIFRMDDNYTFESELTRSKIQLVKGRYKIKSTDTLLMIRFDIQQNEK